MARFYTAKAATGTYSFGPLASDEVVQVGQYDHPYYVNVSDLALGGGTCKVYISPATTGAVWTAHTDVVADGVVTVSTPCHRLKVTLTGAAAATLYCVCGRN